MTANAMNTDLEKVRDAGMSDLITKPFDPLHLYQIIANWLASARATSASVNPGAFDTKE